MNKTSELDELLFKPKIEQSRQADDLKQYIENIPYPHVDITITSYSEFSDNTPQKYKYTKPIHTEMIEAHSYKVKRQQTDPYATDEEHQIKQRPPKQPPQDHFLASGSGGSYLESMTPQRMNRIVDWTKNHVTPGDSKNIFPQVCAPSIEFSNENSVNAIKPLLVKSQERLENKVWEKQKKHMDLEIVQVRKHVRKLEQENAALIQKVNDAEERYKLLQEKHKDYSCLENLRGRHLEQARQQQKVLKNQMDQKDQRIQNLIQQVKGLEENDRRMQEAISLELRELHSQLDVKEQMIRALKSETLKEEVQQVQHELQNNLNSANQYINKLKQSLEQQIRVVRDKDQLIHDQEQSIINLQNRLNKEQEYRKQDEVLLSELRQKESVLYSQINQATPNHVKNDDRAFDDLQREYINQKKLINQLNEQLSNTYCLPTQSRVEPPCLQCQQSREELQSIIAECSLEEEAQAIRMDERVSMVIREVVTLLLTKQREQIDNAFQQYEDQQRELSSQVEYFRDQNDEVLRENQRIQEQIQSIIQQKEVQEQQIFDEYEKLRLQNQSLTEQLRSPKQTDTQALQIELTQLRQELHYHKQQLLLSKNNESKLIAQQNHYKSCQDGNIEQTFKQQIQDLTNKLTAQEGQINQLTNQLNSKVKLQQDQNHDSSLKKQQKLKEKVIAELNEEKNKLQARISQLEQQPKNDEKAQQQVKELTKKNIELYNQNRQYLVQVKEMDENQSQLRDEVERLKKQLTYKNQEIKALLEQVKQIQDKNIEVNHRVSVLQQQLESDSRIDSNIPVQLKSQPSQKDLRQNTKVTELVEGFTQYQQEFYQLKKMFNEKLRSTEQLQETLRELQQRNIEVSEENSRLRRENDAFKHQSEDRVIRGSDTRDSLNIRSFVEDKRATNVFQQNLLCREQISVVDMLQPEMISLDDTMTILKEILRRATKSLEMIKAVCAIPEIRELLYIIIQIDDKCSNSNSHTKRNKIITSVMLSHSKSNSKRQHKQSHRSDNGVIDFLEHS